MIREHDVGTYLFKQTRFIYWLGDYYRHGEILVSVVVREQTRSRIYSNQLVENYCCTFTLSSRSR